MYPHEQTPEPSAQGQGAASPAASRAPRRLAPKPQGMPSPSSLTSPPGPATPHIEGTLVSSMPVPGMQQAPGYVAAAPPGANNNYDYLPLDPALFAAPSSSSNNNYQPIDPALFAASAAPSSSSNNSYSNNSYQPGIPAVSEDSPWTEFFAKQAQTSLAPPQGTAAAPSGPRGARGARGARGSTASSGPSPMARRALRNRVMPLITATESQPVPQSMPVPQYTEAAWPPMQYQPMPAPQYTQAARPNMPVANVGPDLASDSSDFWDRYFKEKERREAMSSQGPPPAGQNPNIRSRDDVLREIIYGPELYGPIPYRPEPEKRAAPGDDGDGYGYGYGGESHPSKKVRLY
ncbi:hypothetical protein B0T24DRAFT_638804 [Lasiosphaeria ovina]|uniref:Uncharacterized protein n=1 Tax=Lasiosphaeria ovina TaxID=92902 RepID=A0AAE0JVY1_9PEZI|nr:hypothetical protein B0T24DRAFT_638804 [Lasiosphaeria ovina]